MLEIYELARDSASLRRLGNSLGELHAKIVVNWERFFVGSMNMDGRSERYNADLGS